MPTTRRPRTNQPDPQPDDQASPQTNQPGDQAFDRASDQPPTADGSPLRPARRRARRDLSLNLETALVQTADFRRGVAITRGAMTTNGVIAIDGVPGTGKTTCSKFVAQNLNRPTAVVTMSNRPAPLELLRRSTLAITGHQPHPRATRFEMQEDLLDIFDTWGGVLIVDELQNTEANAMQELTWLYEESDRAFGLMVVGSKILRALARHPQLQTRVMGAHTFRPLRGRNLISTVRALDPRFNACLPAVLAEHDQEICAGLLRRWVQTVRWLNALAVPTDAASADMAEVLAEIRTTMPFTDEEDAA